MRCWLPVFCSLPTVGILQAGPALGQCGPAPAPGELMDLPFPASYSMGGKHGKWNVGLLAFPGTVWPEMCILDSDIISLPTISRCRVIWLAVAAVAAVSWWVEAPQWILRLRLNLPPRPDLILGTVGSGMWRISDPCKMKGAAEPCP